MTKIRVLELGMSSNYGGVETYLIEQFRTIDKEQFSIDFAYASSLPIEKMAFYSEIVQNGAKVYLINHNREWQALFQIEKFDIVVGNFCDIFNLVPLFVAKKAGVPRVVFHSHNGGNEFSGMIQRFISPYRKYIQKKLKRADIELWACSKVAAKWMFGSSWQVTFVHNGIDTGRFAFDENIRNEVRKQLHIEDRFVIGHVGRFAKQKNHVFLLKVLSQILQTRDDVVLLLIGQESPVGNGYFDAIKKQSEMLNITDKILFLGLRSDTERLYQAMDCFLLPSFYEGLPIVGIEAQTAGLNCFFSDRISHEAGILSSVLFLPIDYGTEKNWADAVLSSTYSIVRRSAASTLIRLAGYDIHEETQNIQKLLSHPIPVANN